MWLDDNPKLCQRYINAFSDVEIEVVKYSEKKLRDVLKRIKSERIDLILVDHYLSDSIGATGATVAEWIRQIRDNVPIICVTGHEKDEMSLGQQSLYDEIIRRSEFRSWRFKIEIYAANYKYLRATKIDSMRNLLLLFNAPIDESSKFVDSIPANIKQQIGKPGLIRDLAVWTNHKLLGRPGFLFDRLWTANLIGLNLNGFTKVESVFNKAMYSGIFKDANQPRWWANQVKKILFNSVKDPKTSTPWKNGEMLKGIKKTDLSLCQACTKRYPETIGHLEVNGSKLVPLHYKCSQAHPSFSIEPYYEDMMCMKENEDE